MALKDFQAALASLFLAAVLTIGAGQAQAAAVAPAAPAGVADIGMTVVPVARKGGLRNFRRGFGPERRMRSTPYRSTRRTFRRRGHVSPRRSITGPRRGTLKLTTAQRKRWRKWRRWCRRHRCWRWRRYRHYWYTGPYYVVGGIYYWDAPEEEVHDPHVPEPWTPAWFRYCRKKHATFDPKTGYYLTRSGKRRFCRR